MQPTHSVNKVKICYPLHSLKADDLKDWHKENSSSIRRQQFLLGVEYGFKLVAIPTLVVALGNRFSKHAVFQNTKSCIAIYVFSTLILGFAQRKNLTNIYNIFSNENGATHIYWNKKEKKFLRLSGLFNDNITQLLYERCVVLNSTAVVELDTSEFEMLKAVVTLPTENRPKYWKALTKLINKSLKQTPTNYVENSIKTLIYQHPDYKSK